MHILQYAFMAIAVISALVLITAVAMQTNKADSFSAAMGGSGDQGRFRKGSREEMLDKMTKYSAIVWILSCAALAIVWYNINHPTA